MKTKNREKQIAILALGSNLGDRHAYLKLAEKYIGQNIGDIVRRSSIYETAPWGYHDQPYFLNRVLEVETLLQPSEIIRRILRIEKLMGRKRTFKNAARIIDIDILFYDDLVLKTKKLTIPHPAIEKRQFVLQPLSEIAPSKIHPVIRKKISELASECSDDLEVKKLLE